MTFSQASDDLICSEMGNQYLCAPLIPAVKINIFGHLTGGNPTIATTGHVDLIKNGPSVTHVQI